MPVQRLLIAADCSRAIAVDIRAHLPDQALNASPTSSAPHDEVDAIDGGGARICSLAGMRSDLLGLQGLASVEVRRLNESANGWQVASRRSAAAVGRSVIAMRTTRRRS
jgi:hypothetical protein